MYENYIAYLLKKNVKLLNCVSYYVNSDVHYVLHWFYARFGLSSACNTLNNWWTFLSEWNKLITLVACGWQWKCFYEVFWLSGSEFLFKNLNSSSLSILSKYLFFLISPLHQWLNIFIKRWNKLMLNRIVLVKLFC